MENRSSHTVVGIFTVVVTFAIIVFVWWLTTRSDSSVEYKTYYIHTKELPQGLKDGSQVRYIGVPAGYVSGIDFADSSYSTIEIELKVKEDYPIKKDSIARSEGQGISGLVVINLTKGSKDFSKDEKRVLSLDAGLLSKLNEEATNITTGINEGLDRINSLLGDENLKNLNEALASINSIMQKLDDNESTKKLKSILSSTDSLLKKLDSDEVGLKTLVKNIDKLVIQMTEFSATSTKSSATFNKTMTLVNEGLENGEYNVKEILSPTLHEATLALIEFKKSLREFQNAMFRLEDDPYDFFFRDTKRERDK